MFGREQRPPLEGAENTRRTSRHVETPFLLAELTGLSSSMGLSIDGAVIHSDTGHATWPPVRAPSDPTIPDVSSVASRTQRGCCSIRCAATSLQHGRMQPVVLHTDHNRWQLRESVGHRLAEGVGTGHEHGPQSA